MRVNVAKCYLWSVIELTVCSVALAPLELAYLQQSDYPNIETRRHWVSVTCNRLDARHSLPLIGNFPHCHLHLTGEHTPAAVRTLSADYY